MKALYLFAALFVTAISSFAQTDTSTQVFSFVEHMPEFPGGNKALMSFMGKNIVYPEYEKENNIQGKVLVRFVVYENGSVQHVQVIKKVSPGIDSEAIRVVKLLPDFEPGTQQGKRAKVYFTLPVSFKLTEPHTSASAVASPAKENPDSDGVYTFVEGLPEFPGGNEKLNKSLAKNIQYPERAIQKRIQGKVLIIFVLDVDGSITDVRVRRSLDPDLDAEAVRIVKLLPKFTPATHLGKPVKIYFNIPVEFKL